MNNVFYVNGLLSDMKKCCASGLQRHQIGLEKTKQTKECTVPSLFDYFTVSRGGRLGLTLPEFRKQGDVPWRMRNPTPAGPQHATIR
jgi:hypothetical protein